MATKNKRVVVYLTDENEKYIAKECESLNIPVSARINYIISEYQKMGEQMMELARTGKPVVFELKMIEDLSVNIKPPSEIKAND